MSQRRSSPALRHLHAVRTPHTGAATDTSSALGRAIEVISDNALPILVLGAVGAVFGGTLWGVKGMLAGLALGGGAGFGVQQVAASSKNEPDAPDTGHPDFSLPSPGSFKVPVPGDMPKIPFPSAATFIPTPSLWNAVSTVNSRARVEEHRGIAQGNGITFIAQYTGPLRSGDDTADEVKIAGRVMVARPPLGDQDPAYGVLVEEILAEHDVTPALERPKVGQKMVVSIDQVLTAGSE